MKSQKGMTMLSMVIYVASFLVVAGIVGAITTYFYNNMSILNSSSTASSAYNVLNVYIMKQVKTSGVTIEGYGTPSADTGATYLKFRFLDGSSNTFVYKNGIIYFNKIKLCENANGFEISKPVESNGKTSFTVTVQLSNSQYKTTYVLEP